MILCCQCNKECQTFIHYVGMEPYCSNCYQNDTNPIYVDTYAEIKAMADKLAVALDTLDIGQIALMYLPESEQKRLSTLIKQHKLLIEEYRNMVGDNSATE